MRSLKEPETRWAGIMRDMPNTDFQTNNFEFIEFWMLSPFIESQAGEGELVFNLGNVSEDILRDSRRFFENGLPTTEDNQDTGIADTCIVENQGVDITNWSKIPRRSNLVNNFDDSGDSSRIEQDVGYDGFNDDLLITIFVNNVSILIIVVVVFVYHDVVLGNLLVNDRMHVFR